MDKQAFKKVEAILYNYKDNVTEIKNLELELQFVKNNYNDCRAIEYSDMPVGGGCSNTVENEVITREREIRKIENMLNRRRLLKQKLDNVIESLDKTDKKLVRLRYLNEYASPWGYIAVECGFSETYCRKDKRERIINKISKVLNIN